MDGCSGARLPRDATKSSGASQHPATDSAGSIFQKALDEGRELSDIELHGVIEHVHLRRGEPG
jgi:hypothetical protein